MAVTKVRQNQIKKSGSYLDNIAVGEAAMETASTDNQFDLNALRSQIKRITGATNYYDDLITVNSKKRSVGDLNTALNTIETKSIITFRELLTNITVGSGNNYVTLSVAASEVPSQTAGVTGNGAVVAVLADTEYGSNRLTVVTGSTALTPKNMVRIVDASTKDPIKSGEHEIFGLIQAEFGTGQGDTFNDTDKRVQISFVINDGTDALTACPLADIQNKTIEYMYPDRVNFEDLPEDTSFPFIRFTESGTINDLTLSQAMSNQGATAVTQSTDIQINVNDTQSWRFKDSTGTSDIFRVRAEAAGDSVEITGALNQTGDADVTGSIIADSGTQSINIGVTTGQIDSAGSLTLASTGANNLSVSAGSSLIVSDGNKAGSTFTTDLVLSDNAQEFSDFEANFGEVSILNAINQAREASGVRDMVVYEVDSDIAADGNFSPASHTTISGTTPDWTSDSLPDAYIYVNGIRLIYGTTRDYEAGTTPASGDMQFNFALNTDDTIIVEYG